MAYRNQDIQVSGSELDIFESMNQWINAFHLHYWQITLLLLPSTTHQRIINRLVIIRQKYNNIKISHNKHGHDYLPEGGVMSWLINKNNFNTKYCDG